jgi:ArsR family transcriptional regulator, arsenate/arsenite/antimonite-responsive transcriptional repressor
MGHEGTVDLKRAARWFHALAEETRLRIVEKLRAGEECVCNLTDTLETGQSRLSFHLKTLKDAGLVKDRRQGRWIYYSLDQDAIRDLESFVRRLEAGRSALQLVLPER